MYDLLLFNLLHILLVESTVHDVDAFWVDHVGRLSRFAHHLDKCKGDDATIDNLLALSGMFHVVGQKSAKERPEPDGMSTYHNVSLLDGRGKGEIAKIPHAFQSVRVQRFVPGV